MFKVNVLMLAAATVISSTSFAQHRDSEGSYTRQSDREFFGYNAREKLGSWITKSDEIYFGDNDATALVQVLVAEYETLSNVELEEKLSTLDNQLSSVETKRATQPSASIESPEEILQLKAQRAAIVAVLDCRP